MPTYLDVGTFWAELEPLKGREAIIAKQVYAEATHTVRMRWLGSATDLDPLNRLIRTDDNGTRTFGIIEVRDIETRNRQYELIVQEIQQIERL